MNKLNIYEDYTPLPIFNNKIIKKCINRILLDHNIQNGSIQFIIVNDDFLSDMKKKYFKIDVYTDVIAFNLGENDASLEGEVYISWDRILENAKKLEIMLDDEFKRIIIHGVLHLIGYNDKTEYEKYRMTELENKYMAKYKMNFYT